LVKNLSISTSKKTKLDSRAIHNLISLLTKELDFKIKDLNVNFIDADSMLELNNQYLKHDYNTDIITFNYSGSHKNLDGEIFISIDETVDNSLRFNVNLDSEIIRLISHGFLHLLGYDDVSSKDKKVMKKIENKLVEKYEDQFKNLVIEYDC